METQFWLEKPSVLISKQIEIFPKENMSYNSLMNMLSIWIVFCTVIGFILTKKLSFFISGILSLLLVIVFWKRTKCKEKELEGMRNLAENKASMDHLDKIDQKMIKIEKPEYTEPTKENPLMNVQLTEINENPDRAAAAPAFNDEVAKEINNKTQDFVVSQFDDDPKIRELLFKDIGDQVNFDNSMRNFYATASTTVPSDQQAFAEFCYGGMKSCKDGDVMACERNNYRKYPSV